MKFTISGPQAIRRIRLNCKNVVVWMFQSTIEIEFVGSRYFRCLHNTVAQSTVANRPAAEMTKKVILSVNIISQLAWGRLKIAQQNKMQKEHCQSEPVIQATGGGIHLLKQGKLALRAPQHPCEPTALSSEVIQSDTRDRPRREKPPHLQLHPCRQQDCR